MEKYYKVGEKFTFEGVELDVVESKRADCDNCYFKLLSNECLKHQCTEVVRKDKRNVIFIPTKK